MNLGPNKIIVQALLAGAAVGLGMRLWSKRASAATPTAPIDCSSIKASGGTIDGIRYLETIRGGTDPNVAMPMVVVFHSRGATPEGAATFPGMTGPLRIIRPAGFHRTDEGGYTWFATSLSKTPDLAVAEMRERATQLQSFLGKLMACRPTLGRPIVTGSSEGGHVSYLLASSSHGLIGGAVALLGYLPPPLWNSGMAPTVGIHSSGDTTIPLARTEQFWAAVKAGGADLATQVFPGGHSISEAMSAAWRAAVSTLAARQRTL